MKEQILKKAFSDAKKDGLHKVSAGKIAKKIGVTSATVFYYFKTAEGLSNAVVVKALEKKDLPILAQALSNKNNVAVKMPAGLKKAVVKYLLSL